MLPWSPTVRVDLEEDVGERAMLWSPEVRVTCGGRGCLEATCSGRALAVTAPVRLQRRGCHLRSGSGNEPGATELVNRAGRALGRALASWAAMTFPDLVVVTVVCHSPASCW